MSKKTRYARLLPVAGIGVSIVIGVIAVLLLKDMFAAPVQKKKQIQMISLVQPPPPPPPKEEPPPPEIKEEVKIDEPEPQPDEPPEQAAEDAPPPGEDLGVDADGGAGSDAFGLVGRKGGRDLLGGSSGSEYAWYANVLQQDIADLLSDNNKIRQSRYIIEVQLWFEQNGKVKKAKLIKSSGDAAMDRSIQLALNEMGNLRERPPEGIPQPVRLRIESRL